MPIRSPYEAALGERLHELHPSLRRYFQAIPDGHIGLGEGVFAEFGTTRRWLWPLLRPFERRGVLFGGHACSVRFRVINRTVPVGDYPENAANNAANTDTSTTATAAPVGLAVARRELDLPGGTWVMTDSVALICGRVVDRIGSPQTVSASFNIDVHEGALTLTSRAVGLRFGALHVRIPNWCAPRVTLTEQHDPVSGLQRVEFALHMPIVGSIYGYRGHFSYGIVREHHGEETRQQEQSKHDTITKHAT